MKACLFTLLFLFAQIAAAGPSVSGGLPSALDCHDVDGRYEMKFIFNSYTVGVNITENGEPIYFGCEHNDEMIPQMVNTELQFKCDAVNGGDTIEIFKNLDSGTSSGLLVGHTPNGVPRPTPLECVKSTP